MHRTLVNPITHQTRSIPTGFSWVLFLFSGFYGVPLFIRGLIWHGLAVAFVALLAAAAIDTIALPIVGLLLLAAMAYYGIKGNELTVAKLLSKGWRFQTAGITPGGQPMAVAINPPSTDAGAATDSVGTTGGAIGEKICPQCAETIKAAATVCRYCGYSFDRGEQQYVVPRTGSKVPMVMIAALVIGGLLVLGLIASESDGGMDFADTSADAATASEEVDALAVTATELFAAYNANEQAAQMKYGGTPLEVTGRIAAVELDINDEPMVSLEGDNFLGMVTLHFDMRYASDTAQLSKGENFTAVCSNITEILGSPQLNDCRPGAATRSRQAAMNTSESPTLPTDRPTPNSSQSWESTQCNGRWMSDEAGLSYRQLVVKLDGRGGGRATYSDAGQQEHTGQAEQYEGGVTFQDGAGVTYSIVACDSSEGYAELWDDEANFIEEMYQVP